MAQIKLYLPETADNYLSVKGQVERFFCQEYGGFTATHGHGGWQNPDTKEIVKEPVRVYEVFASGHDSGLMLDMKELAQNVKAQTGESAVMFAINGEHVLV